MNKVKITSAILCLALLGVALLVLSTWNPQQAKAAPEPEAWVPATPLPQPLASHLVRCAYYPDDFFLVGGIREDTNSSDKVYRYNIPSAAWMELAPLPVASRAMGVACYRGKLYVAGGRDPDFSNSLYIYDITDNYWSPGPDLPEPVWGAGMGVWDGKLYLVGGTQGHSPYTPINRVDVFDIQTGVWTAGGATPMPTAASFFGSVQAGQYLYAVGGYSGDFNQNVNQTQRYNLETGEWEVGPQFHSARALGSLAATGSHLYMLGGDLNGGGYSDITNMMEELDLSAWPGGTWVNSGETLPAANGYPSTTCSEYYGGEIWDVGGMGSWVDFYDEVWYRPTASPCVNFSFGDLTQEEMTLGNHPGGVAHFVLPVYNAGTQSEKFDIEASGTWTVTAPAETALISPGTNSLLHVQVDIPAGALPGEMGTAIITITSRLDPAMQDTAALTALATSWQPAASLDDPLGFHTTAACVDEPDVFYVIGGGRDNFYPVDDVMRYDSITDTWTWIADMPMGGWANPAVCYQGNLYLAQNLHLYSLDLANPGGGWSNLGLTPRDAWAASMGAWNGKLFIAGGGLTGNDELDIYDIASQTWITGTMPLAVGGIEAVQAGPYLYLVGGTNPDYWYFNRDTTLRLNMETLEWDEGPSFTSRRMFMGMGITSNHLYAIGGDQNVYDRVDPTGMVEVLDLSEWPGGAWEEIQQPLPWPVEANWGGPCTQGRAGGEVWTVGGASGTWTPYTVNPEVYYLPTGEACVSYIVNLPDDPLVGAGYPGTVVDYEITITNTGYVTDYFTLEVSTTWGGSLPAMIGPLGAGEGFQVVFSVNIPPEAQPGEQEVSWIKAASVSNPAAFDAITITTTANQTYGVELAPPLVGSGENGAVVGYLLVITNTGNGVDSFTLEVSGTWAAGYPSVVGPLGASEATQVAITVTVPLEVQDGDQDVSLVTAVSLSDPAAFDTTTLTTLARQSQGVDLPEPFAGVGEAGTTVEYLLAITNTGLVTDTFTLEISSTWTVSYPLDTGPVGPGESSLVLVTVAVPAEAVNGDQDTGLVTATSASDPTAFDTTAITTLALAYDFALEALPPASQHGYPGDLLSFTLHVSNTGGLADSYAVEISATWEVTAPLALGPLLPGDRSTLLIVTTVPTGALAGAADPIVVTLTSQGNPQIIQEVELNAAAVWYRTFLPVVKRP